jgi:hypothetical protein
MRVVSRREAPYGEPAEVKSAIDIILYDEWQLPRKQ